MSKGSRRRPMSVPESEYAKNWNRAFGEDDDELDELIEGLEKSAEEQIDGDIDPAG